MGTIVAHQRAVVQSCPSGAAGLLDFADHDDHAVRMSFELDLSFWETIGAIIFVLGVGLVFGSHTGGSRGFFRATVAGVLGSLTGLLVAAVVLRRDDQATADDLVLVAFGFALLATMVISVSLEAVLRPRRWASGRPADPSAHLLHGRRPALGGARIARRNGLAGPRLASEAALSSPEGGLRIRNFLQDCGGMFIKFGQIASTRIDLLPAPRGRRTLRPAVECQTGAGRTDPGPDRGRAARRRSARCSRHSPTSRWPRRRSGRPTPPSCPAANGWWSRSADPTSRSALPGIRRCSGWASRAAVRRSEAARSLGLVALADELVRSVEQELSYVHEAANARALGAVYSGQGVRCRWW